MEHPSINKLANKVVQCQHIINAVISQSSNTAVDAMAVAKFADAKVSFDVAGRRVAFALAIIECNVKGVSVDSASKAAFSAIATADYLLQMAAKAHLKQARRNRRLHRAKAAAVKAAASAASAVVAAATALSAAEAAHVADVAARVASRRLRRVSFRLHGGPLPR